MTTKLVELLMKCGFIRIRAGVLAQLIKTGKGTARELERECDLRQPEVSLALGYFAEKKWVTTSPVESESGRGRPTLLYTLIPVEILFQKIQEEQQAHIKQMQDTLAELKSAMMVVKPVQPEIPHVSGKQLSILE
jgi:predicted transcriptional regulator